MEDEKIGKIKSNLDSRIQSYYDKMNKLIEVPVSNKSTKQEKTIVSKITSIKIDYKFIIVFVVICVIVFFILQWINPDYIQTKQLNNETYFNENVVSTVKLVGYSLVYSIVITALIISGIYIYNNRKQN